jgi:AraC-like DNA-binding protein
MYVLRMTTGIRITISEAPPTRIGQLLLAGEVHDTEPATPRALRTMPGYVLSVVTGGQGTYRSAAGQERAIEAGTVTLVRPNDPHWYGTAPGQRWTELFAVFTGPIFDTLAGAGVLPPSGPRTGDPLPAIPPLLHILRTRPGTTTAAEHQLLAVADWLIDAYRPDGPSPDIAAAASTLADALDETPDMPAIARAVGLSYDTFRRRFAAEIGQSPLAYRNRIRLQTAATLLRGTDLTLRSIARNLGYTDEYHLSHRFRAHYGVPPSHYRKREIPG